MSIFLYDQEPNPLYENLIEEIRKNEVVWNPKNEKHRSRRETIEAWSKISKSLNISEYAAKTKWKMLRTIFQRHLKKHQPKDLDDYYGKWKYFRSLWYLKEIMTEDVNGKRKNLSKFKKHFVDKAIVNVDAHSSDDEFSTDDDEFLVTKRPSEVDEQLADVVSDSDELFLKSLAPFMRKLPPIRNLTIRSKFQEILMKEMENFK